MDAGLGSGPDSDPDSDPGTGRTGRAGTRSARRRRRKRRGVVIATVVGSVIVIFCAVGVALVVTREDEPGASKVTPRPRATSTSSTSTTTSTTVPVSTTVVPVSPDPVVQLAQQYDGRYVGAFTNTTFGTTGPASLELLIDPATSGLTMNADFDGDLFGGDAKAVRRLSGTITISDPNAVITTDTEAFGQVTGRLDEGLKLVLTAEDVPGPKVKGFTLTGGLREDLTGFDATYTVAFEDGSAAEGTVTVTCDPAGSRTNEVTTICALTQGTAAPAP